MMLADVPGQVVSKAEFFERIWDGAHVSEDSLFQCIAEIRQAIGGEAKTVIETIPRKGYRLNPTPGASRSWAWRWLWAALVPIAAGLVAFYYFANPSSAPAPRVIAVLPFQDDSVGPNQNQLGDLLSAEILASLARFPQLSVIARNSSFRFREQDRDLSEIADQLGADLILEGSQHLDGSQLRVTAQLINVEKNSRIWSDQIDTDLGDLLKVSTEISRRIANSVEAFVAEAQAQPGGQNTVDALLLNQKARRFLISGPSKENVEAAISAGTEAVTRYPDQAWGHIAVAFALRTKLRFGWSDDPQGDLQAAIDHAQKAVSLAPDNFTAHFALGRVRMQEGNQIAAIAAFEAALLLNPSSADVLNALAQSYFYLGQNERALEVLARSAQIDPLPGFIHPWMSAWVLWQDQQCDQAYESFQRIPSPRPPARKLEAVIQVCRGEVAQASKALATFLSAQPDWTVNKERNLHEVQWIADGALPRWLDGLIAAGLPE